MPSVLAHFTCFWSGFSLPPLHSQLRIGLLVASGCQEDAGDVGAELGSSRRLSRVQ